MQGDELKRWRKQQGWTQEKTAHFLGTTKTSVHRWEADIHNIPQTIDILTHLLIDKRNIRIVENFLYKHLDT
jgi:transcriptional regulator with XRE-family HTH domain